jgi:hypothetical protein
VTSSPLVRSRCAWALCLSLMLIACATPTPPLPIDSADLLSGRLAVVVAGPESNKATDGQPAPTQSLSAAFELRGSAQAGSLDLISPRWVRSWRARVWSPEQTLLTCKQSGQPASMTASPALTRDMLGESSAGGKRCLTGCVARPWAAAPSEPKRVRLLLSGFSVSWAGAVDLSRWYAGHVIVAERERACPRSLLRARLDRP